MNYIEVVETPRISYHDHIPSLVLVVGDNPLTQERLLEALPSAYLPPPTYDTFVCICCGKRSATASKEKVATIDCWNDLVRVLEVAYDDLRELEEHQYFFLDQMIQELQISRDAANQVIHQDRTTAHEWAVAWADHYLPR